MSVESVRNRLGRVLVAAAVVGTSFGAAVSSAEAAEGAHWSGDLAAPIHLYEPSLAVLPDGRIFAVGQRLTPDSPPFAAFTENGNAAVFDPADDSWTRVADPAHARVGEAVVLGDGRVAVIGGSGLASSDPGCPTGAGEVYDPEHDTWAPIPAVAGLQCGGSTPTAVLLPDGRVLIHSGIAAVWDPATGGTTAMPAGGPNYVRGMVAVGGQVFATAAWNETNGHLVVSRFDPRTGSWSHGSTSLQTADSKRQNLHVIDASTLFFAGQNGAALIDTATLAVTSLPNPSVYNICGAGVLADGAPMVLGCGGQDAVSLRLDRSSLTWEPLPNDVPARHSGYVRTVSAPSGTYVAGLRINIDGFDVARYAAPPTPPANAAPVAGDLSRSVRSGASAGLTLQATDADGDPLTFAVTDAPDHGSLSGTAPNLTYTADGGYTGPDGLTFSVDDGEGGTDSGTVAITVTDPVTGATGVSQVAGPGQTVATGDAPTADEPTQVGVTTPDGGPVSITQDPTVGDPAGYVLVGPQFRIEAPPASVADPLRLAFALDAGQLPPGQDETSLQVFRDGTAIAACADASGTATPDPCVSSRVRDGATIRIVVLSSHASGWTVAVSKRATTTSVQQVAASAYGQPVTLRANVSQAGPLVPGGSVTFTDTSTQPATVLGTRLLDGTGTATLGGVVLPAGTHAVVASYGGSATSLASASAPRAVVVAKAPVTITTSSTTGLVSLLTFRVTYTSTVRSAVTGAPVAGVPVTTRVDGGSVNTGCTAVTNASGVATCTAGPVQISIGTPYTALSPELANYLAGRGTGFTRVL